MRVYSYKISRDYGFAPNPFHGTCTLATCKPQIRRIAKEGDLIIGCGSTANDRQGKVICALRVSSRMSFQEYWNDDRYAVKRPNFRSGKSHAYGDNIYHRDATGNWIQERSHHTFPDGSLNQANLERDTTTSEMVLLGGEFVYFGRNAQDIPDHLRSFSGDDLYPNVRDFRSRFSRAFVTAIDAWFRDLPRGVCGLPINWK